MSTETTHTTPTVQTSSRGTGTCPRRRLPRGLATALAALVVVLTSLTLSAQTAGAFTVGGPSTPTYGVPGWIVGTAICDLGKISVRAETSVQSGYVNGQYMQWAYNLQSNKGHNLTSGWSGHVLVPFSNYHVSPALLSTAASFPALYNTTWTVHVMVRYWHYSGGQWTYSDSGWRPAVYFVPTGGGNGYHTTACHT